MNKKHFRAQSTDQSFIDHVPLAFLAPLTLLDWEEKN